MKQIHYIIEGILAATIVLIFVSSCNKKDKEHKSQAQNYTYDSTANQKLPIAYVNIDSLLTKYNYAKDINEALVRKQENARIQFNQRMQALQGEMNEFQKKVDNNAFLSRERAESEQRRLMGEQQKLQTLEQKLTNDLLAEQQKMNEQLRDEIYKFLKEYNKEKKYQLIFSNTMNDNILLASPEYDITNEVVDALNKKYTSKSSK